MTKRKSTDCIKRLIKSLEGWVDTNARRGLRNLPSTKKVMPETIQRIRQLRGIVQARSKSEVESCL